MFSMVPPCLLSSGCDVFAGYQPLPVQSVDDLSTSLDLCLNEVPSEQACCLQFAPGFYHLRDDKGTGTCIEIDTLHRRIALVADDGPAVLDASKARGSRILSVAGSGTQVHLQGFVLQAATVESFGAGIWVTGVGITPTSLTVANCTLQNCTADEGGAISNKGGSVNVSDSVLRFNTAFGSTGTGGAIANQGALRLRSVRVHANQAVKGGGLYNDLQTATLVLNGTELSGNRAVSGGGLHNEGKDVIMSDTLFEGNAPDALYNGLYSQMSYHLPAPRGRYLDGVFECREQQCKLPNGSVVPCPAQQCDWRNYADVSMTSLPQGVNVSDDAYPPLCAAGYLADGISPQDQSSPLCASPCPAGHYCDAGAASPTVCAPGTFAPQLATASADGCLACPAGFNCSAGSTMPDACPGLVPPSRAECRECPPGAWCNSGIAFNCPSGTFANPALSPGERTDLSACVSCPDFAFTHGSGATSLAQCICFAEYYRRNATCQPCVIGMDCDEADARHGRALSTASSIRLKPEFWRTSTASLDVRQCPVPQVCVGDDAPRAPLGQYCARGLGGAYCLTCNQSDTYLDTSEAACRPCAASRLAGLLVVIGVALVGASAVLAWRWRRGCGCCTRVRVSERLQVPALVSTARRFLRRHALVPKLKQLLSFYQIQTHVYQVYDVAPPPPGWLAHYLDILNLDPFGLPGVHIRCFYMPTFFSQLLVRFFVPVVAIALVSGYHACRGRRERALPFALWLTFLTFSQVSTPAFQAFSCEHFDDGSSYLRADYSVDCNDPSQYGRVKTLATVVILVYPVGVPLTYLLLLFSSRRSSLAARLGFLTDTYKPRCFYWELVEVTKRLLLGSFFALPFMGPGTFVQLLSAVLVALFFLVTQLAARPFKTADDTHFAALASAALVVGLLCCVALNLDDVVRGLWANLSSSLKARFELQGAESEGRAFKQAASGFKGSLMASATMDVQSQVA